MPDLTNLSVFDQRTYAEALEIERHLHNREMWFGKKGVQTATDWADPESYAVYRCISGNAAYGSDANDEALVIGTDDTPYRVGMTKYDLHRIFAVDFSAGGVYMVRIIYGSGTMAAAITAGQYSVVPFITPVLPVSQAGGVPIPIIMPRVNCGVDKIWIQCKTATDNATLDFLVGLHEYAV